MVFYFHIMGCKVIPYICKMDWNQLYCDYRTGVDKNRPKQDDPRSEYQRDFDRIIFSSAFRRLQNKTQVFPMPGSVFVHNRLTHSLELASVGRSLGTLIGDHIIKKGGLNDTSVRFYREDLKNVISAGCLCHDIGNPPFGHSGESAISNFFIKNEKQYRALFSLEEWHDIIDYEGNANAIRLMTSQQKGKSPGGLRLTYTTLASIIKYPCESKASDKKVKQVHRKKYGFFQSEKNIFLDIAKETNMAKESSAPIIYKRHPFVYLVEAADDICYTIIDLEDAHRLGIISHESCATMLLALIDELESGSMQSVHNQLNQIQDKNERIAYLRARSIGVLARAAQQRFINKSDQIIECNFHESLLDQVERESNAWRSIQDYSIDKIYNNPEVVKIEIAGFKILYTLLEHFIPVVIDENHSVKDKKILRLIPDQFKPDAQDSTYESVMMILDFISGMTDPYASSLYRKISGISIGLG